jgi:hypothetical protein
MLEELYPALTAILIILHASQTVLLDVQYFLMAAAGARMILCVTLIVQLERIQTAIIALHMQEIAAILNWIIYATLTACLVLILIVLTRVFRLAPVKMDTHARMILFAILAGVIMVFAQHLDAMMVLRMVTSLMLIVVAVVMPVRMARNAPEIQIV